MLIEFAAWTGAVFLVFGLAAGAEHLAYRYGPIFWHSWDSCARRFRSWRLNRRVTRLARKLGYVRDRSLGKSGQKPTDHYRGTLNGGESND